MGPGPGAGLAIPGPIIWEEPLHNHIIEILRRKRWDKDLGLDLLMICIQSGANW